MVFSQETAGTAIYKSDVDSLLTINKIAVLPFTDNLNGIYARPLEEHFLKYLKNDHHWDVHMGGTVGPVLSPNEISLDPERAKQVSESLKSVDAYIATRVIKGPKGMHLQMAMFLTKDSKLISQKELKDSPRFNIGDLKPELEKLFSNIKKDLPYSGRILSRDGNRVTLNLGMNDGIAKDQIIPVIQVIKINRHPKFHFIVSTEKEILGRVRLLKIDETLSFGKIVTEREKGAIQKGAKVAGLNFVTYPNSHTLADTSVEGSLKQRGDGKIAFGENPKEWEPKNPPTFGRVAGKIGLGQFTGNAELTDGTSAEASNPYYPSVLLEGELWLTTKWAMHFNLGQGIIPVDNSSGSTPSELSQSLSKYELLFGYYIRMGATMWDPWIEIIAGYASYRLFVDDSNPRTFTTMEYTGFKIGVLGQTPVSKDKRWSAGGKFHITWSPSLNESPVTSGTQSDSSINEFGGFVGYKYKHNVQLTGGLDFALYSSSFSGNGTRNPDASSASHRHTVITVGANYFF